MRAAGEALERCQEIRDQLATADEAVRALEGTTAAARAPERPRSTRRAARNDSHARTHAIAAREALVTAIQAAGVPMERESEAVYRTHSGSRVAMPYSKELEPGKWWLGSYIGRFDEALLLCELGERTAAFHLDHAFVREKVPRMSRDSTGNVKFNVERDGAEFKLRLGGELVDLQRFDPATDARSLGR